MFFGWGQKFKCGAIESFDNLKWYIDLGDPATFKAGCLLGPTRRSVDITAEDGVVYPNQWHNDTMLHLGNSTFAYRGCWGRSGAHDWDKEVVHGNTIYVQSADVDASIAGGACPHRKKYTLEEFQALGEEPGSRRLVDFPTTSDLLKASRSVLGSFAPAWRHAPHAHAL